jgi:hypothetical protein
MTRKDCLSLKEREQEMSKTNEQPQCYRHSDTHHTISDQGTNICYIQSRHSVAEYFCAFGNTLGKYLKKLKYIDSHALKLGIWKYTEI